MKTESINELEVLMSSKKRKTSTRAISPAQDETVGSGGEDTGPETHGGQDSE